MRGLFLIGFALFIDALQAMLGLTFFSLSIIPFLGQVADVLAMVIDIAISVVLGGGLIIMATFLGYFYPVTIVGAFLGESIPILDALIPGWTLMAARLVYNKHQEEKQAKLHAGRDAAAATQLVGQARIAQSMDGIRAANDNQHLYDYQAAA